jgi:hypothetical protein
MADPGVQAVFGQRPNHEAFQQAFAAATDDAQKLQLQQQWQSQMDLWRGNLLSARQSYQQQQFPNWNHEIAPIQPLPADWFTAPMTPGGGGTGAPSQGPNTQFPLNPGSPGQGNDWRTFRAPKIGYGI